MSSLPSCVDTTNELVESYYALDSMYAHSRQPAAHPPLRWAGGVLQSIPLSQLHLPVQTNDEAKKGKQHSDVDSSADARRQG